MNNQHTEPMVDLVIENLHLFDYTVISINEEIVTLNHHGKIIVMPTDKFMLPLNVHLGAIRYALDNFTD